MTSSDRRAGTGRGPDGVIGRLRRAVARPPRPVRVALVATIALRVGVAVIQVTAGGLIEGLEPVPVQPVEGTGFAGWDAATAAEQGPGLLGAGLERFDALWYLAIAEHGYPVPPGGAVPQAAAFFPALPALIAVLAPLVGGLLPAATVIGLAAATAGLAGLHRLTRLTVGGAAGGPRAPRLAVVAAAAFPTAFFLVAPYTEGLFLAASVWALVWGRQRRWWPAAAAAVLAGLTRNVGVLLAVPLAVMVWRSHRAGRLSGRGGAAAAVAAGPAGLGVLAVFGQLTWGTPVAIASVQSGWERTPTWPWESLLDAVRFAVSTPGVFATGYHTLDLIVFLPVAGAVGWLLVRRHWALGLYAAAHVLVWLAYPFPSRPLMSTGRFALAVAPVFVVFGWWLTRHPVRRLWLPASGALLGIHLLLFTNWHYVF